MEMLKVSSTSDPTAAGGAIANGIEVQVIGPRAVNQAVKAIAIARGYLAASGIDLYCIPSFTTVRVGEGQTEKTAIQFLVKPRHGIQAGLGRTGRVR